MASADGIVVSASFHYQSGNVVIIDHGAVGDGGQREYTLDGHLGGMTVQAGEQVIKGQEIGESGSTRAIYGPPFAL